MQSLLLETQALWGHQLPGCRQGSTENIFRPACYSRASYGRFMGEHAHAWQAETKTRPWPHACMRVLLQLQLQLPWTPPL